MIVVIVLSSILSSFVLGRRDASCVVGSNPGVCKLPTKCNGSFARDIRCGERKVCCPTKRQDDYMGVLTRKTKLKCGRSRSRSSDIDGSNPWIVSVRYFGRDICSGTLVSPNHVLTAAMCVNAGNPNVVVRENKKEVVVKTVKVNLHPDFNSTNMANNIAMLELEHSVGAAHVCLGHDKVNYKDNKLEEIGWDNFDKEKLDRRLVEKVDGDECLNMLNQSDIEFVNLYMNDTQLMCTKDRVRAEECVGEPGGPLLVKGSFSGSTKIVGVRTIPLLCGPFLGLPNFPGIFTMVGAYQPWIMSQME